MKERGESLYKEYLSDTEAIVAKVKKNIPSKIAKVAAIGLVVGAGIGFIVKKVKESKAQKADM